MLFKTKKWVWLLLSGCIIAAAVVRLSCLGMCPFRADTIEFYRYASSGQSIIELWKNPPWGNQIPLNESIVLLFFKLTNLEVTEFTVRFPFAFMGICSVLVMFLLCRQILGTKVALLCVALSAFNPAHIYTSREAYHYSGVVLFSSLALFFFWKMFAKIVRKRPLPIGAAGAWFAASLICCHCHMSAWAIFGAQCCILGIILLRNIKTQGRAVIKPIVILGVIIFFMLLVLSPWIRRVFTIYMPNTKAKFGAPGDGQWLVLLGVLARFVGVFTFGTWLWGVLLLIALLPGAAWMLFKRKWRKTRTFRVLLIFGIELLFVSLVMAVVGKGKASFNYLSVLWPLVMILLAFCVAATVKVIARFFRFKQVAVTFVLLLLVLSYLLPCVWANIKLEGKPVPYRKVVDAIEENISDGAPVLVDKWFIAVIQMALYSPSNASMTYLFPDEPIERYIKLNWREQAAGFFEKYKSAAYLEITKTYFDKPEVGPWHWPRQYFKKHIVIKNEPGLLLRKWGVVPRGAFYTLDSNSLIVELFYNTPEDVVENEMKRGSKFFLMHGKGWGFTKTRDYRSWKVLGESAEIALYNLGDQPISLNLGIQGVAVQGTKQLTLSNGQSHTFAPNQMISFQAGPFLLKSGKNIVTISDPWFKTKRIPLFVGDLKLIPIAP